MDRSTISLFLFVLAYVLFVAFPGKRSLVAISAAGLLLVTGVLSFPEAFRSVNWNVMGIFVGTLAVADVFMKSRVPAVIAEIIVDRAKNTVWAILLMCALAGFISAFVDNIPFLAAMLPVAIQMASKLNVSPSLFLFGILIGASLGGNITPIGASANIVTCGLLKKEGYVVRFKDFMRIGIPFTLAAVIAAYLFVWFVWKP